MGIFNFLQEILDPDIDSEFNFLKNYHREALNNWLNYGYFPRHIIPPRDRDIFNNHDKEYSFIRSKLYDGVHWIDNFTYNQKKFIVSRKQEILRLYSIFQKYKVISERVIKLADEYKYGFNSIAVKYGKFYIEELFNEYEINTYTKINYSKIDYSNPTYFFQFYENLRNVSKVKSLNEISYEQANIVLSHIDELCAENSRISIFFHDEEIKKASNIAKRFPYAYQLIFNYPLTNLTFLRAKEIIEKKSYLEQIELNHKNEEIARKKKAVEIKNLSNILPNCVSSWNSHSNSSIKHKYFFDYYPYERYKNDASPSMYNAWKIVWNFKNDPDKNVSIYEHRRALDTVIKLAEEALRSAFGSYTEYLTLVCLAASTQKKTELRYKDFSNQICKDLNMKNAFSHIQVEEDGIARHLGGKDSRSVSYEHSYFYGKFIVLFDDVRTTGQSLEQERQCLEKLGAKVICAVTIAQTTY